MGFLLNCTLRNMEYRSQRSGTSQKNGQPWLSLVLEDSDANQIDVSVPVDLQSQVYALHLCKGDVVSIDVRAAATNDYSYVRATSCPVLVADSDGVIGADY